MTHWALPSPLLSQNVTSPYLTVGSRPTSVVVFVVVYSPRKLSIKEPPPADDNDDDLDLMLNDFQQQRAAKALQRHWRGYQGRKREVQEEEMKKNSAAVTLQKNWRRHRERVCVT